MPRNSSSRSPIASNVGITWIPSLVSNCSVSSSSPRPVRRRPALTDILRVTVRAQRARVCPVHVVEHMTTHEVHTSILLQTHLLSHTSSSTSSFLYTGPPPPIHRSTSFYFTPTSFPTQLHPHQLLPLKFLVPPHFNICVRKEPQARDSNTTW